MDEASGQPKWLEVTKTGVECMVFFCHQRGGKKIVTSKLKSCHSAEAEREFPSGPMNFCSIIVIFNDEKKMQKMTLAFFCGRPAECAASAEPLKEATRDSALARH